MIRSLSWKKISKGKIIKQIQAEETKYIYQLIDEQERVVRLKSEFKESESKNQKLTEANTELEQQLGDLKK